MSDDKPADLPIVMKIVERACALIEGCREYDAHDMLDMTVHLLIINANYDLDFRGLLVATPENFTHDIVGMLTNTDEETGLLDNGFLPKYAMQFAPPPEVLKSLADGNTTSEQEVEELYDMVRTRINNLTTEVKSETTVFGKRLDWKKH